MDCKQSWFVLLYASDDTLGDLWAIDYKGVLSCVNDKHQDLWDQFDNDEQVRLLGKSSELNSLESFSSGYILKNRVQQVVQTNHQISFHWCTDESLSW